LHPADLSSDPDGLLMREAQKGDKAAFENLMHKYYHRVLNVFCRAGIAAGPADVLTQEVFVSVYRAAGAYSPQVRLRAWLYKFAVGAVLKESRRKKRGGLFRRASGAAADDDRQPPQAADAAVNTLLGLPDKIRLAVILKRFDDLGYEDIGFALGISAGEAKALIRQGREMVRDGLAALVRIEK